MSEIHNATGGNADAPSTVPYRDCAHGHLARSCEICEFIGETGSLRAQLAQREGEIEALRAQNEDLGDIVRAVLAWVKDEAIGSENGSTGYRRAAWDVRRIILNCDFLAFSDNPESPALTDKEA